ATPMVTEDSWEKLSDVALNEVLDAEALTELEIQQLNEGQFKFDPASARWRSMGLKLLGCVRTCEDMRLLGGMIPHLLQGAGPEPIDQATCPRPPWAQWSSGNQSSWCTFCWRCGLRLCLRSKTDEEKAMAQVKKQVKAKAKEMRAQSKAVTAAMMAQYERDLMEQAGADSDPWTPTPPPKPPPQKTPKARSAATENLDEVPGNLYVPTEVGYIPYKEPPPDAPVSKKYAQQVKGADVRPMTQSEMMRALSDMKVCLETQQRSNELTWQGARNLIRENRAMAEMAANSSSASAAPRMNSEDLAQLAQMMVSIQSGGGAAPPPA
ncbi:unnamed protein product, partial [Prorocentrum cordatum]